MMKTPATTAVKAENFAAYLKTIQDEDLEAHMDLVIKVLLQSKGREYLTEPVKEHEFHHSRKWRFDYAWKDCMVAIEIEGGTWKQTKNGRSSGHAHPARFESDCEKYNEAARLGWRVFRFTGKMIKDGRALETLEAVFPPF